MSLQSCLALIFFSRFVDPTQTEHATSQISPYNRVAHSSFKVKHAGEIQRAAQWVEAHSTDNQNASCIFGEGNCDEEDDGICANYDPPTMESINWYELFLLEYMNWYTVAGGIGVILCMVIIVWMLPTTEDWIALRWYMNPPRDGPDIPPDLVLEQQLIDRLTLQLTDRPTVQVSQLDSRPVCQLESQPVNQLTVQLTDQQTDQLGRANFNGAPIPRTFRGALLYLLTRKGRSDGNAGKKTKSRVIENSIVVDASGRIEWKRKDSRVTEYYRAAAVVANDAH
jgi:hypothetical protein